MESPTNIAGTMVPSSQKVLLFTKLLVFLLVLKFISAPIYNVFFHPLRKYPGPKLATATSLVYWKVYMSGDIIPWLHAQHERYGEVVRVSPDRLSYINPQAWKDIYGHRVGNKQPNRKDPRFYGPGQNGSHPIISIPDEAEHGRIRRIFSHAFSDRGLKEQEPLIRTYVDQFVVNIGRRAAEGAQFDLVKLYNCTTFDIMGDLAFGEPLGLLENSEYSPWVKNLFSGIKVGVLGQCILEFPWLGALVMSMVPASLKTKMQEHFDYSIERVDRRLAKGNVTDRPDIWSLVLKQDEGKGLPKVDMYQNASLFMIAGTETTATQLSGLTYHLLMNPDKMRRLVDEIRGTFASDDDLTIESLQRLKYMAACFEEGLRMYPPVPTGLPRETPAAGNAVMGEWIPGKTRVYVAHWAAYHSEKNFKDANSFVPERWLPGTTGYETDRKDVMQPFSIGPRNCIGKNLAYHEMRLILAKALWHYDLELCPESKQWLDQKCYSLWEKKPLIVKAKAVR